MPVKASRKRIRHREQSKVNAKRQHRSTIASTAFEFSCCYLPSEFGQTSENACFSLFVPLSLIASLVPVCFVSVTNVEELRSDHGARDWILGCALLCLVP